MGTARSTSSTATTPRKRAPRKATAGTVKPATDEPAVVDTPPQPRKRGPRKAAGRTAKPAVDAATAATVDTPPAPAPTPADPGADRIAKLRQMIADEGLDPDKVLAGTQTGPDAEPARVVDGTVVDAAGYPDGFEPIPGVDLAGIRQIVVDARRNPATADVVIGGLRSLIAENGHDPDAVIAAATGEGAGGGPATNPNGLVNAIVDFRDRRIEVTAPEIEQVMVIRRMQSLFANAAKMKTITADEAIRLMDRALKAVCSVVVNPDDVEYLEDLLLTREAKIEDTLPLLRESLKALERANADNGNRAARRKAAKSSGRAGRAALVTAE